TSGAVDFAAASNVKGAHTFAVDTSNSGAHDGGNVTLGQEIGRASWRASAVMWTLGGGGTKDGTVWWQAVTRSSSVAGSSGTGKVTLNGNVQTDGGHVVFSGWTGQITIGASVLGDTESTAAPTSGAVDFAAASNVKGAHTFAVDTSNSGAHDGGNVTLGQ